MSAEKQKQQEPTAQRESVDYDLVRKGMEAGERAALESRARRGMGPGLWAILLLAVVVLMTSLLTR